MEKWLNVLIKLLLLLLFLKQVAGKHVQYETMLQWLYIFVCGGVTTGIQWLETTAKRATMHTAVLQTKNFLDPNTKVKKPCSRRIYAKLLILSISKSWIICSGIILFLSHSFLFAFLLMNLLSSEKKKFRKAISS